MGVKAMEKDMYGRAVEWFEAARDAAGEGERVDVRVFIVAKGEGEVKMRINDSPKQGME